MIKRSFDLAVAIPALILLSPLILLIHCISFIIMERPIFFCQERPGLNGNLFIFYKFCTMTGIVNATGQHLPDEQRLTRWGKFLRRTSIDELPSLINVIKGDMSLVGPRPLLVEYLDLYTPEQARRHEVKPGITGWAQINGRNAISWEEKFKLDVWYVNNQSFFLDLKILIITIWKVFKGEGINQKGQATMEYFTGGRSED